MTDEAEAEFIASLGGLMERWGLPQTTGRLLGYLLLRNEPVDLDTMVKDLGASKSGLSVAARQLEAWFLVRRSSRSGSRRVCYEVVGDIERLLTVNTLQIRKFSEALRDGASVAKGPAAERLADLAGLFEAYVRETTRLVEEYQDARRPTA
ncbi:ArsR family transcriptional regulator [Streptomyces megasporus]|uniref:ArsR family transcriptional regulator n=1 Tax=Streptomyces megasporus TaxID=44060 RepID=UPI000566B36E|nr:ArsR family transcriptional regulator [Streptomyces megasporus]